MYLFSLLITAIVERNKLAVGLYFSFTISANPISGAMNRIVYSFYYKAVGWGCWAASGRRGEAETSVVDDELSIMKMMKKQYLLKSREDIIFAFKQACNMELNSSNFSFQPSHANQQRIEDDNLEVGNSFWDDKKESKIIHSFKFIIKFASSSRRHVQLLSSADHVLICRNLGNNNDMDLSINFWIGNKLSKKREKKYMSGRLTGRQWSVKQIQFPGD